MSFILDVTHSIENGFFERSSPNSSLAREHEIDDINLVSALSEYRYDISECDGICLSSLQVNEAINKAGQYTQSMVHP